MSEYPGKLCKQINLSCNKLLSLQPLRQVKLDKITNGLAIELIQLRNVEKLPWKVVIEWLVQLYGRNWPTNQPAELTLIKTLTVLYQKHRNLVLKRKASNIEMFKSSPLHLPVHKEKPHHESTHSSMRQKKERKSLLRKESSEACRIAMNQLCIDLKKSNDEILKLQQGLRGAFLPNLKTQQQRERRQVKRLAK